jgi:hypothetical protein
MSGFPIDSKDYVSYFINDSGERVIFVQKQGEKAGTLLHSDMDWEPKPVSGPTTTMADVATPEQQKMLAKVNPGGGLFSTPMCGDVILEPLRHIS